MSRWRTAAWIGTLGVFALGLASAAIAALIAVTPGVMSANSPLTLAIGEGRRADLALAATPPDLALGAPAAARASALAPYDSSARLRLAYIDALDGELGPEGMKALELSYELLPFDHYVAAWRVRFALDHWAGLTPELRARVESEAFAFARTSRRPEMISALSSVRSPVGIVPATFWRLRMQRDHRRRVAERRMEAPTR